MALPVKKSQGEPATVDRGSVGAVPTSATKEQHLAGRSCGCSEMNEKEIKMFINDGMAAESKWAGGGWQAEGEDGCGGIAPRLPQWEDFEVPLFGYPHRPRHPYFSPAHRAAEQPSRTRRSPQAADRARQARIARRRNG